MAADVLWRQRSEQAETAIVRSRAYKRGEETAQEWVHGELK